MPKKPKWQVPADLATKLEDGDGAWEDKRWSPLLVTAMSGTVFNGREIPVSWQLEFSPRAKACKATNAILRAQGAEPDGYVWGELIRRTLLLTDPKLANRLQLGDCESATCVIWVETEEDCQSAVETAWELIFVM